ncbi:MAG: RNA methyltransferase [Flavobacteriales bacterium]|nr:RNA methyltransferase [Flavobacteriales bacterium]MCB9192265.1 RNA methyltransferase [Flavobacteriales bacterium]
MSELLEYLQSFVTENKNELIASRLAERTRYITVVLEDIFESHNTSAVIRSADCFGIQDVHIIENTNYYKLSPKVVKGATKWTTLHQYREDHDNTTFCINRLKEKGYKIVATSPHTDSISLQDLPVDKPLAVMLGTEKLGLSSNAMELADYHMYIPMYGFTESLNLSVSAAICLQHLAERIRTENVNWQLSTEEQNELLNLWTRLCLKDPEGLEKRFYEDHKKAPPK